MRLFLVPALSALCVQLLGGTAASAAEVKPSYVVVASEQTYANPEWRTVMDTLRRKHDASLILYRGDVTEAREALSEFMPRYTCFVTPADRAGRDFLVAVQRMTRKLDADPYTDTQWAILTGYTPEDALRIAEYSEPLRVKKIFSGTVSIGLDHFKEGYQFSEAKAGDCKRKLADGTMVEQLCPVDSTELITAAFQDGVDAIYTSGHGTEQGWQIGYSYPDGAIRGAAGEVYGLDSKGRRIDFKTANPKIYLPAGNCLIGHIPQRDCYATAMMHSAGVNQMFGYTVVTFYGYMGWGICSYFEQMGGEHTLSDSFYANQQALLYEIGKKSPALQTVEFKQYDYDPIRKLAEQYAPQQMDDATGMLWDRDAVAFYGDPAWEAVVDMDAKEWVGSITRIADSNRYELNITFNLSGKFPDRPLFFFLPQRLENIELIDGEKYAPVLTDNFVMVPLSGSFKSGESVQIIFSGTPVADKATSQRDAPNVVGTAME
ncbi:MAG: hypothetical protein JXR25_13585 [Pontiellaceae bacterium]|nr:hypothetical protein [Pontiellaceae bacterium]MBN2785848.1 hypothetical protein [Pontiellaceae bacterium]